MECTFPRRKNGPPPTCATAHAADPLEPPQSTAPKKSKPVRPKNSTPPNSKRRKKSTCPSTAAGSRAEILGTVEEKPSVHLRRCDNRDCPRCTWYKFEGIWKATCGRLKVEDRGPIQAESWLQVRPLEFGGTWAIGCLLCSLAAQALHGQPKSKPRAQRLKTQWSTYTVRCKNLQCRISEHANSQQHRDAIKVFRKPSQNPCPVAGSQDEFPEQSDDEAELFKKKVPQPQDWCTSWNAVNTNQSWTSAAKSVRLFEYGSFHRGGPDQIRKQLQSMAEIMREAVRRMKRNWLADASAISLGLDDRKK